MAETITDRKTHWENVYRSKLALETSWYQAEPRLSLDMIARTGINTDDAVIDVGGGTSLLVEFLLELGFRDLTVLDISAAALQQVCTRLGPKAREIKWIEVDITEFEPHKTFALWHDRAVFHFLTDAKDRKCYMDRLDKALKPGGRAIIATFAPDGPSRCSGLDIVPYDAAKLGRELGEKYRLEQQERETHITPAGGEQKFGFYCFRKMA